MAREEKVWEYAMDAGFAPLEDRCIIVKGAAGDLSEKIVRFFETWDMAVLQMCENELILLPFESFWGTLERDVSLVIPYADIESVKLIDDLLNVVIDIETSSGAVRLTTQQKELSDLRLSGIYATQYAGGYKKLARRERKTHPRGTERTRPQSAVRIGHRHPLRKPLDTPKTQQTPRPNETTLVRPGSIFDKYQPYVDDMAQMTRIKIQRSCH